MADLSTYTDKFRAEGSTYRDPRHGKVVKRTRQKLSCIPCTTRKLKCDRGRPCETCVKRSSKDTCTYERTLISPQDGSRSQTYEKLASLEQLLRQTMESEIASSRNPQSSTVTQPQYYHTPPEHSERTSEAGSRSGNVWLVPSPSHTPVLRFQNNTPPYVEGEERPKGTGEISYKGSTHWSTILDNIQELKVAMRASPNTYAEEVDNADTEMPEGEILFGSSACYSMQQILSEGLPPRIQIDRRLSSFFKAKIVIIPYIHTGHFQRQYEKFWTDPLGTSPLWVSMLFSLCCIAATIDRGTQSEPHHAEDQQNDRIHFLTAAAQCLVLSGYTRPQPYVIEALALYAQCKYMHSLDPSRELCIILSTACRLAYMMGYHRDPDNYGNFTAFEGEMRRRTWSSCRQFDLMVSFQFGLPSNIHIDSLDTKSPRNLLDSDFDENTKELPLSRPETEPTPILYFVVKHNLLKGFTRVCNHALSLKTKSQLEITELDAELRQMYSSVPESLRIRPMAQSLADPPFLVITRLYIAFLHQKCLCILHRGHMVLGHQYSTEACVNAATVIITHFMDVNREFEVGGQLYADRWALSSFNMNDFLLAVMILCLSLSMWRRRNSERKVFENCDARSQLDLLKQAYAVCVQKATTSKESGRVVAAVATILAQFNSQTSGSTSTKTTMLGDNNTPGSTSAAVSHHDFGDMNTTLNSATSDTSIGGLPAGSTIFPNHDAVYAPSSTNSQRIPTVLEGLSQTSDLINPFQDIFDDFENMDWTYLDQCLVGSNAYEYPAESD